MIPMDNTTEQTSEVTNKMDTVDAIMLIENGDYDSAEQYIEAFQILIDAGIVWSLQGSYGRTAKALLAAGHCHA